MVKGSQSMFCPGQLTSELPYGVFIEQKPWAEATGLKGTVRKYPKKERICYTKTQVLKFMATSNRQQTPTPGHARQPPINADPTPGDAMPTSPPWDVSDQDSDPTTQAFQQSQEALREAREAFIQAHGLPGQPGIPIDEAHQQLEHARQIYNQAKQDHDKAWADHVKASLKYVHQLQRQL